MIFKMLAPVTAALAANPARSLCPLNSGGSSLAWAARAFTISATPGGPAWSAGRHRA
jgi:hypothetical protein